MLLEKVPLMLLAVASGLVTIRAHERLNTAHSTSVLPMALRVDNAFVSYGRYLKKVIWPNDLAVLYLHPKTWAASQVWSSLLLLIAITAVVVWWRRRKPYLFVGWFWFVGVLLPTIGILQVGSQAMADRFAYQPLIGLFLLITWGVADWAEGNERRLMIVKALSVLVLVGWGIVSWRQVGHWKNSIALYEHTLSVTRDNYVIEHNLAYTLHEAGRMQEAEQHALAALRINPLHFQSALLLGLIYEAQHRTDEALAQLTALVNSAPNSHEAHSELGLLLGRKGRTSEALHHYREALQLKPDWPELLNNTAWLLATASQAEIRDGAEAVRLAERACQITERKKAFFLGTLAAAYAEAGRFDDAVETAQEAHDLALATGDQDTAAANRKLLETYRAGRAFHQSSE
jgi:Flp pilus assembly protein TadD